MKISLAGWLLSSVFYIGHCNSSQPISKQAVAAQTIYTFKKPSADGTGKFYMGREIAGVMGAAGAGWLERNNRQEEENTREAIENMKLATNSVVADIGAGTGYYTFRIAQKTTLGKVYAVEIQEEMIQYLDHHIQQSGIKNVTIVKGSEQSPNLPGNTVDMAIMVDVYHELAYPHEILQALRRSLKTNGKLILLEYRAEDPAVAIKPLHKMSVQQVNKELNANGFTLSTQGEFLPIQHFLVYRKIK